jgi:cysteine desulfuration protein SufE
MTIGEIQEQIIEEFAIYDDWMDKYNYLIELSKDLKPLDAKYRAKEYLIEGCQSRVWLAAEYKDGIIEFFADSDAIITKGIVALLIRVLSNQKPKDIKETDLYFIDRIGLRANLSPTRSNGLLSMVKQMKLYALAWDAKMGQV